MTESAPAFNLWWDPWIQVRRNGALEELSLRDALRTAPELGALHELSPLVVAGIHRLLSAIAQAVERPASAAQLGALLGRGELDTHKIDEFGARFGDRFDLFSPTRPFLQTADVPLAPRAGDKLKTVAYLAPEVPAGTEVTHWHHGTAGGERFCPRCCAGGLVAIPAFATSGGAGIKPSINGVPPLYVLPQGDCLFEALALSVITPPYQPQVRSSEDVPWWESDGVVRRGEELLRVGYLQAMTFPARRVRLFPTAERADCTRCGRNAEVLVRSMVFEMGVSRPKDAAPWFDPFAAYRIAAQGPIPIRPQQGKPPWRDYAPLFLTRPTSSAQYRRPSLVDQVDTLVAEGYFDEDRVIGFRCVGMRTDMKAKIFEWVDDTLRVPAQLLSDPAAADEVLRDSQHAKTLADDLGAIFGEIFDPKRRGAFRSVRERMLTSYWSALEPEFRRFALAAAEGDRDARREWAEAVVASGRRALAGAADEVGDRGEDLARQARASAKLNVRLARRRKEWLDEHEAA